MKNIKGELNEATGCAQLKQDELKKSQDLLDTLEHEIRSLYLRTSSTTVKVCGTNSPPLRLLFFITV